MIHVLGDMIKEVRYVVTESILTSIKKMIGGIDEDCTAFDTDIIIHINSALAVLTQLGIGPAEGFSISDSSAKWIDFLTDDKKFEMVKTYVYMKVKLVFDPPLSSAVIEAMKQSIAEFEWRLNVLAESKDSDEKEEIQNG